MPSKVTDASFDKDVLNSSKPVLVDFWAEWCTPCRQIAPALEELSGELGGKIAIAKMNIDENPTIPMRFGVKSIPTLMIFKGGQVSEQRVGLIAKDELIRLIDTHLV